MEEESVNTAEVGMCLAFAAYNNEEGSAEI